MTALDFSMRTRIVYGADVVDRIGTIVQEQDCQRALLVTDKGVASAGHVERAEQSLVDVGVAIHRYDDVPENPTSADVDACHAAFRDRDAHIIIGLGGGSSIDVAKGCNFLRAGGGTMEDYQGYGKAVGTMLPMIAVPTTAGTGSEVQSYALIGHRESHQKMACGDPQAAPRIALLDPTLTVTQPAFVTACTGLDALGHAVETAVTSSRTQISSTLSTEAFRLACENFSQVLKKPDDLEARGGMLMAAACAGMAIENSMLGVAHAIANPLTAHHGITHGQAVGMMLPIVVRFNAEDLGAAACYATLARSSGVCPDHTADAAAVDLLIASLESMLESSGLETTLAAFDVKASDLESLASEAAEQWTAQFNPRPVTAGDFVDLLNQARPHPSG